ncbi:unnamed protein product [Blepharisma stoltei]|uniref:Mre11 DNA-binding domain-containing protein n=1 Tax=Blepharisma stoltei TaxID=1481888 RepID=A0AAU9IPA1_9CILI|nr:unnamed protein product [Blepharisma stoltei]
MAGDIFRIMIATDNHLGYYERDQVRKDDSFRAVEEVLSKSLSENVDFLLLGGDLFHEHNPTKYTLNRTFRLFADYVVGQRPLNFETLSTYTNLNYLNPSIDIKLPVFIVHGNHDDPSMDTHISAVNLMQNAHYVNYIYAEQTEETIQIKPIILKKGTTLLAIYGLGHLKDEKLNRYFKEDAVKFLPPPDANKYFHICVIHQNRFKGHSLGAPAKNCVMDWQLPKFIDLVIWGHEHDSYPEVRTPDGAGYVILQPGSTVATSLTEGEALQKHMFLLEVKNLGYRHRGIPIANTRPILYKQIELDSMCSNALEAEEFLTQIFNEMLAETPASPLMPPLARIKVECSGFEELRVFHLNSIFSEKVANKDVICTWKKAHASQDTSKVVQTNSGYGDILQILEEDANELNDGCSVFHPEEFVEYTRNVALKGDNKALEHLFDAKKQMAINLLNTLIPQEYDELAMDRLISNLDIKNSEPTFKRQASPKTSSKKSGKKIKNT